MIAEVIVDIAHSEVDRVFDYLCGDEVCAGMRVTVPFARSVTTGIVMRVKEASELPPEKLKKIIRVLDELPALNAECLALAEKLARRYRCPKALVLRLFLPAEMRTGKVSERLKSVVSFSGDIELIPPRAKRQRELAEFLSARGEADLTALREEFGSAVKGLEERGMLHTDKRRVFRDPYERLQKSAPLRPLTPAQEAAVHTIERTQKTVTLIHGVTGSGKTEIYLTLIAHALEAGKSAIFLVPEISLTPQMFAQLRARFQMSCAILHSGLSAGERFDEWERLRSGEARIAIGARSSENQLHRLVSSGIELPVGIKNPTGGSIPVTLNSVFAAQSPQVFMYHNYQVATQGNEYAHVVLRGRVDHYGNDIPNYHYETVMQVCEGYAKAGGELKNPAVVIDSNHSNSKKQFRQQIRIVEEVLQNRLYDKDFKRIVKGFMIESFLEEGRQDHDIVFGKSITDPCLGWEDTERLILDIAEKA